jgi:hypothetical protein
METMKVNFKLDDNYQARLQATPLNECDDKSESEDEGPPPITQMETMNVNFKLDDNYNARLSPGEPTSQQHSQNSLNPIMDSGPPKITQVDSFNPSFDPVDDYDRKLEPNRPISLPKDDIWGDINELRNELISKSGPSGPSGSSPGTNSYISSEQKNAVTRMGTNEMVDIQRKPKSKPTSLEGPPPITQMETMNVNFSPNDDYNGQLAGKTPDTQIRKTQFFEQSEAMQENLYEQIVERRHRE